MPSLSIRVDLKPGASVGPGKVRLLELVAETGSISAAARAMGMSYRRGWLLIDDLKQIFQAPLVETAAGGAKGGGARLTPKGEAVVSAFRALEQEAARAAAAPMETLMAAIGSAA